MNATSQFKWIRFYTDFASSLLTYKDDRRTLIQKIQKTYDRIRMKLPKLEKDGIPKDVDPFTIFGLFNKGIADNNRKSIIGGLICEFSIDAEVPDDFPGIPVLHNRMATFYAFEDTRREHDIDNLWAIFAAALALADEDSEQNREKFSLAYNQVLSQFGVRWNITMGLYWIRPCTYLNLDSRNRWYMSNPANLSASVAVDVSALKAVPSAEKYLELRDKCAAALSFGGYDYKSFPELSYHAWITSKEYNQREKAEPAKSNASFLKWFRPVIQALRDLGGSATPADARKKIIENERLAEAEIRETRGRSSVNKFENEVAFARSYLVSGGYMDNSVSGVWTLTEAGMTVDMTDELASDIFKRGLTGMKTKKSAKENALGDADVDTVHHWLYTPGEGSAMWDNFFADGIMRLGWHELGDLNAYANKEEMIERLREIHGGAQADALSSLRGKLEMSESMKTQTFLRKQMVCAYDEFSVNSYLNRIIKSTVLVFIKADISKARKKELRRLLVFFTDVDVIDLHTANWNVQYNRNNQTYRMLISICCLAAKGLLQTQSDGTTRLMDFLDEQRMHHLYEKFILEYFKKEFPQITASTSQIPWQLDDGVSDMLPVMQTDIMLSHGEKTLIIDAKYYAHTTQARYGTHTLHSENLYQIFTYVKNKEAALADKPHEVAGMLLYAKTDEDVYPEKEYRMSGNSISVRTLDLDDEFSAIRARLDGIVVGFFGIYANLLEV